MPSPDTDGRTNQELLDRLAAIQVIFDSGGCSDERYNELRREAGQVFALLRERGVSDVDIQTATHAVARLPPF